MISRVQAFQSLGVELIAKLGIQETIVLVESIEELMALC